MISAKLIYNDGKDVVVNIAEAEFSAMFSALAQGQVFWNANQTQGFWTSFENIRFIQFTRNEENNESKSDCNGEAASAGAPCEGACAGSGACQDEVNAG